MDLPEVVSLRKFKDFSKQQKEELFETLLELAEAIEELPKKSLRKTLELTLAVLEYKGEQIRDLQEQLEANDKGSLGKNLVQKLRTKKLLLLNFSRISS